MAVRAVAALLSAGDLADVEALLPERSARRRRRRLVEAPGLSRSGARMGHVCSMKRPGGLGRRRRHAHRDTGTASKIATEGVLSTCGLTGQSGVLLTPRR